IRQSWRLRNLVNSLPSPSSQRPTLLLLFESQTSRLLTANEPCTSASAGSIHLCLDLDTVSKNNPVLVASAFSINSRRRVTLRRKSKCCSTVKEHLLPKPAASSEGHLYSHLL